MGEEDILKPNTNPTYFDPKDIKEEPDLLCFSYWDMNNLLDIKPDNGMYIYSACETYEDEAEFDFFRLQKWLEYFNFIIYGFSINKKKLELNFDKNFHASGHISSDGICRVIDKIDPEIIIPIHTESPDWFKKRFDNTKLLKKSQPYYV